MHAIHDEVRAGKKIDEKEFRELIHKLLYLESEFQRKAMGN